MDTNVLTVNMDDIEAKRRLMSKIGTLKGLYDVTLRPRKRTRSLNQNAYYFAALVTPWTEWLREQSGDPSITSEQAHIELKRAVLGTKEIVNKETGDVIELTRTSRNLDTAEFSEFIEGAARFLAEFAGIVVIPSELFFEDKRNGNKQQRT